MTRTPLFRSFALAAITMAFVSAVARAQSTAPPPLDLMQSPRNPVEYYQIRQRAFELAAHNQFAAAESLAERLTREFPRDGETWHLLGRVKVNVHKHREAAAAFERAGSILGYYDPYWADRSAAYAYLDAGDQAAALRVLDSAVFTHRALYRGSLFDYSRLASLRDNAEFRRIAGRPSVVGLSRTQGWQRDIDFLRSELQRIDPDYRDRELPALFTQPLDSVRRNVATLSDDEIVVGINRALAALRHGHTGLWFWPPDSARYLPVELSAFPGGIYITGVLQEHASMLHNRLVAIESTPALTALRAVNGIMSIDGEMEYISVGAIRLQDARILRGLGITSRTDTVSVVVEDSAGVRRSVKLAAERTRQPKIFAVNRRVDHRPPLYLRNVRQAHWDTLLNPKTIYVQVNSIMDDSDETLAAFGLRLRRTLETVQPSNLIVDIRRNGGGNTALYTELLRSIIGFTTREGTQLYVIIGRTTYSAAGNFATDLERLAKPVFAGEPTGDCCNLHGDFANILLPYSQMRGRLSGVHWNRSTPWDGRQEIVPHIPVQLTVRDAIDDRDPVLDAVLQVIALRQGRQ